MNRKIFTIGIVLWALAQTASAYNFATLRNIPYSDAHPVCTLDMIYPTDVTNYATVVNIHGGGLTVGSADMGQWSNEAQDPVARIAINYRLLNRDTSTHVDCLKDAAAATAWVLRNIARFGGSPKKIFLTGVSAGGYLTAMVGMDARWLAPHGLRPCDLAGIIPLTGQMTKHFNVRKIGFGDNESQFLPKIDEFAPLYYANRPNLPPACFCTGGRDIEWPCRVEENELLAVSMRRCGYPKTWFCETEGDHGGGTTESSYCMRDFILNTVDAYGVARFIPGERVLLVGDSITHDARFGTYLQLFANLRHPGSDIRILNCGISGDTAEGALSRLNSDILRQPVNRAFVMFGMNDVGRDYYEKNPPAPETASARRTCLEQYRKNLDALAQALTQKPIKTVIMTPSPFNEYATTCKAPNRVSCNSVGLASCADICRAVATTRALGLVDLHASLSEIFKRNPQEEFCADRVHPGKTGHLLIAAHILESMGYSPYVAITAIDAKKGKMLPLGRGWGSRNVRITCLDAAIDRVSFTYAPKALPFPNLPEYAEVEKFHPITKMINREIIRIKNLKKGTYDLAFDGVKIGSFTAEQFANGVNVALLDTPNQRLAQRAAKCFDTFYQLVWKRRNGDCLRNMLAAAHCNLQDAQACNAWIDNWLEHAKNSPWIDYDKKCAASYRYVQQNPVAAVAELDDLYEQMAAVRPQPARVTITPSK